MAACVLVVAVGDLKPAAATPERTAEAPLFGPALSAWLKRIDRAPAPEACAIARLLEPHLDSLGPIERRQVVKRWRQHPMSLELQTWAAWLDGEDAAYVRSWLVCTTPAGEVPTGVVKEGAPCFSGAHPRWWHRIEADPRTGLVWLDDFVVATTPERDERLHLVALETVPARASSLRFGAAAAMVDVALVHSDGAQSPDDAGRIAQHVQAESLEHAPHDQVVVPIIKSANPAATIDGLTIHVHLKPSRHESTRFRLRFSPDASSGAATTLSTQTTVTEWPPPAPLPAHPCAAIRSPLLKTAFARSIGLPDAATLLEDMLLQLSGDPASLAELQLTLPQVRRPASRQAITSHFLLRTTDATRTTATELAAAVALGRAEVHRAELLVGEGMDVARPGPRPASVTMPLRAIIKATLALANSQPEAAIDALMPLCREPATCPTVFNNLLINALMTAGRDREARRHLAQLAALEPTHPALQTLAQRLPLDSDFLAADAERALRRAEASPTRTRLRLEATRWRARTTSRAQAVAELVAWLESSGSERAILNSQTRTELAELLIELGESQSAASIVTRTLAHDPSDPFARRLDERLRLARGERSQGIPDTVSKNAPPDVLRGLDDPAFRAHLQSFQKLARPGAFEILDESAYLEVATDGSSTRLSRRILRAGVGSEGPREPWRWRFDPSRAEIRVLKATIHSVSGVRVTVRPLRGIHTVNRRNDSTLLYFDEREVVIPTESIQPGELVELVWLVEPVGHHFPGYFELIENLQLQIPRHAWRIVIDSPADLVLHHRVVPPASGAPPAPRLETLHSRRGDFHRFEARAALAPAIPNESFAPPLQEIAAILQVSSMADHRELGRFWAGLIAPQAVLTPAMKRAVADAVARVRTKSGAIDEARLARDLSQLVSARIRYVGLEFGIHGYKPYRTDDVWARRFGDCKDQALVLVTLLREAGIAADPVLVRTRRLGRLVRGELPPLPMLAAFDHAIVHVRSRNHFVDPTALHYGYDTLHPDNQGADALIVPLGSNEAGHPSDGVPTLVSLPRDPPSRNGVHGDFGVLLNDDGSAHVTGRIRFVGVQAGGWRSRLADESRREQNVQAMVEGRFPGFELQRFSVDGLDNDAAALKLVFEGRVAHLARRDGETLRVSTPLPLGGQRSRLGDPAKRTLPLTMGTPGTGSFEVQWTLPPRFSAVSLPASFDARVTAAHGRVTWTTDGGGHDGERGTVTGRVELTFDADTAMPSELNEMAAFLEHFDSAVARELTLVRNTPEPSNTRIPTAGGRP